MGNSKFIWIDMDNSPHVLFFKPIIKRLTKYGTKVVVTARDKSETLELLKMNKISYMEITEPVKYYGKNYLFKIIVTLLRASKLFMRFFNNRKNIYMAINHGSRSHILAAYLLRIPVIAFDDYEYSNIILYKKFIHKLFIPQYIPTDILEKKGVLAKKIVKYPGFKEELYLRSIFPKKQILKRLRINEDRIIVTLRPPAWNAHYYNAQESILFDKVIDLLSQRKDTSVVVLPRGRKQYLNLKKRLTNINNFIILAKPVDSFSLIYYSDIVIGGGGTMNREAALIGTPVYSIFLGKRPSVDEKLKEQGKLEFINNVYELSKIKFLKKALQSKENNSYKNNLVKFISTKLEEMCKK